MFKQFWHHFTAQHRHGLTPEILKLAGIGFMAYWTSWTQGASWAIVIGIILCLMSIEYKLEKLAIQAANNKTNT